MLSKAKHGGDEMFTETDAKLGQNFLEAGFGAEAAGKAYFSPIEACYLVSIGKSSFSGASLAARIKEEASNYKGFPLAFACYSLVRKSGRVARVAGKSPMSFRVWPPGVGRLENRPSQLLRVFPSTGLTVEMVKKEVSLAHQERLDLIIATGSPSEPRFYKVSAFKF